MKELRTILLDVEGTITSIAFVHDVLFPFSKVNLRKFLEEHTDDPEVRADLKLLTTELENEAEFKVKKPAAFFPESLLLVDYIEWLIDIDRKSRALKSLQGKIWEDGYRRGLLQAPLFPDVASSFRRWTNKGIDLAIFSSGSVLAQRLLLAHTSDGDLTSLISSYFDTSVGTKQSQASYQKIAQNLGVTPSEVLFISDVEAELDAAQSADMQTLLAIRPGNAPLNGASPHRSIHSLIEVDGAA